MVIGAAMAGGSAALTFTMVLVIMMHKFPAAFSISAFSLHERHNRSRSKIDLLVFAAATPIAIILFWNLFAQVSPAGRGLAVLFSAGTFLYIATVDVLPAMHIAAKSKRVASFVLAGIVTVFLITYGAHSFLDLH
jgi:zinc transporter 9